MLMRVSSRRFVAGLVFDKFGRCVRAAPILASARGQRRDELEKEFKGRGWTVEWLPPDKALLSQVTPFQMGSTPSVSARSSQSRIARREFK